MKNQTILKQLTWLLVVGVFSTLTFSACKSTKDEPTNTAAQPAVQSGKEHPAGQEHPTGKEHPTGQEHPK